MTDQNAKEQCRRCGMPYLHGNHNSTFSPRPKDGWMHVFDPEPASEPTSPIGRRWATAEEIARGEASPIGRAWGKPASAHVGGIEAAAEEIASRTCVICAVTATQPLHSHAERTKEIAAIIASHLVCVAADTPAPEPASEQRVCDRHKQCSLGDGDHDYKHRCTVCNAVPTVHPTELCGPCCFGEAETINGNW